MRQLASLTLLTAALLLAWSGPASAGCPEGGDDASCQPVAPALTTPSGAGVDADLPYVEEITAPPVGTALIDTDAN